MGQPRSHLACHVHPAVEGDQRLGDSHEAQRLTMVSLGRHFGRSYAVHAKGDIERTAFKEFKKNGRNAVHNACAKGAAKMRMRFDGPHQLCFMAEDTQLLEVAAMQEALDCHRLAFQFAVSDLTKATPAQEHAADGGNLCTYSFRPHDPWQRRARTRWIRRQIGMA